MINDRVQRLITVFNKNPTSFSRSLGIKVTVIFNIIKGRRSKPSFDLVHNILKTYSDVNANWFIKGEGSMWSNDIVCSENYAPSNVKVENRLQALMSELKHEQPSNAKIVEMQELMSYVLTESHEQKKELYAMYDAQKETIKFLRYKLKLKVK